MTAAKATDTSNYLYSARGYKIQDLLEEADRL